ncbi:hypothetical protein [Streptomyces umbrinus]
MVQQWYDGDDAAFIADRLASIWARVPPDQQTQKVSRAMTPRW